MKVKSSLKKSESGKILKKENKQYGIINYDEDNAYPQRIQLITGASPTAKTCLETHAAFLEGAGFTDLEFYKVVVNSDNQTFDDVLSLVAEDLSRFRGFAIHCNITPLGKITEIFHVPFEHARLSSPVKKTETGFDFALYSDWNKEIKNNVVIDEINWLNVFNLDPVEIQLQIDKCAELEIEYKGQLLYWSADKGSYPLASCDSVLQSMFSEIQSDLSTTNNLEQGFTKKGMFIHKGEWEEDADGQSDERDEFEDGIKNFMGPEGEHVITVHVDSDEEIPEYKALETTIDDKLYQYTDEKVLNKIIRNWRIPKILLSVTDGGAFFNQEQVRDAVEFYNMITVKLRNVLEAVFERIGRNFIGAVNATDDYSIAQIQFKINKSEPPQSLVNLIKDKTIPVVTRRFCLVKFYGLTTEEAVEMVADEGVDKRILADVLGVGGVTALQSILADTVMTADQKKSALIIIFGLTDDQANQLAGVIIQSTNQ